MSSPGLSKRFRHALSSPGSVSDTRRSDSDCPECSASRTLWLFLPCAMCQPACASLQTRHGASCTYTPACTSGSSSAESWLIWRLNDVGLLDNYIATAEPTRASIERVKPVKRISHPEGSTDSPCLDTCKIMLVVVLCCPCRTGPSVADRLYHAVKSAVHTQSVQSRALPAELSSRLSCFVECVGSLRCSAVPGACLGLASAGHASQHTPSLSRASRLRRAQVTC